MNKHWFFPPLLVIYLLVYSCIIILSRIYTWNMSDWFLFEVCFVCLKRWSRLLCIVIFYAFLLYEIDLFSIWRVITTWKILHELIWYVVSYIYTYFKFLYFENNFLKHIYGKKFNFNRNPFIATKMKTCFFCLLL